MPITVLKNKSKDLTVITLNGNVLKEELFNLIHEYEKYGYAKYEIYDLQNFTGVPLPFDDVKMFANYIYSIDAIRPKDGKTAVVHNSSDQLGFGITRQMIALLESENVPFGLNVFYSIDEAYQWLSISDEIIHAS